MVPTVEVVSRWVVACFGPLRELRPKPSSEGAGLFAGRAVSITLALGEHQRPRNPEVVLKSLRSRLSYPERVDEAAAFQPLEPSSRALMATGHLLASRLTTVCSRRGARFRSLRAAETWYVGQTGLTCDVADYWDGREE